LSEPAPPLIIGAGAVGLAAALFLARRDIKPRIIDAALEPATTSRALGVNPRTLAILQPSGVTAKILAEATPMTKLVVQQQGKRLGDIVLDTPAIGGKFPMVILPQARTEALLRERLSEYGVEVERGLKLTGLVQDGRGVTATIEDQAGASQTIQAPILLGADGAHSTVRHLLDIGFSGSALPEDWELLDVELTGPPVGVGWAEFGPDGPLVALPFKDNRWRLLGFGPPLLERLPKGWVAGEVYWRSGFKVSHRVADRFNVGRICLAGDAAHIHSPIGARGMNLGIEDALVFACYAVPALAGDMVRLADYGAERRRIDLKVVKSVERLTNAVRATGPLAMKLRPLIVPLVAHTPALRHFAMRTATGLDHRLKIP
jgi:2-polyprenyl-6-methoxyphenol hydroxylase-like FAD-dependent oxidoreductase